MKGSAGPTRVHDLQSVRVMWLEWLATDRIDFKIQRVFLQSQQGVSSPAKE